jgi:Pyruvate/2-oxoacid:ferredoxin oxidoreductase gamma subunit
MKRKKLHKETPEITSVEVNVKELDVEALTVDEALALLETHISKGKNRVYTLIGGGFALMGCDSDLSHIKKVMKASDDIRLAGPNMTAIGHGVGVWTKNGWEFISTNKEKLKAIHKQRGLTYNKY